MSYRKAYDPSPGFGGRLASARRAAGLSQADLAEKLGTHLNSVRHWETERFQPRLPVVREIGRILGVTLLDLINGPPAMLDLPPPLDEPCPVALGWAGWRS